MLRVRVCKGWVLRGRGVGAVSGGCSGRVWDGCCERELGAACRRGGRWVGVCERWGLPVRRGGCR